MSPARPLPAIVAYFVLAFAISWGGVLLAVAGTGIPSAGPVAPGRVAMVLVAMVAGPTLASLALTLAFSGAKGLRELGARLVRWRVGARWYAALLIAPALALVILGALSIAWPAFTPALFFSEDPAAIALTALVIGLVAGVFEELGWTGFATPRMLERGGVATTGITLGLIWALWHALSDYWGSGDAFGTLWLPHFLQWFVALVAFRILMTWVYARTRSLLLGMLLHASFTGGQALFWPADLAPRQEVLWYGLFGFALWIAVAVVAWRERGHLARPLPPAVPSH